MTDRDLLLSFIASLTLCDHMGDVSNDIHDVLERMGEKELLRSIGDGEEFEGLQDALHARGIKTMCGVSVGGEE